MYHELEPNLQESEPIVRSWTLRLRIVGGFVSRGKSHVGVGARVLRFGAHASGVGA
jgi:hypothetical protein